MFNARQATGTPDLKRILALQQKNLRGRHDPATESREGFLTVAHTLPVLQQMHQLEPSILAESAGELAGFALVMPRNAGGLVTELLPMFDHLNNLYYQGRPLRDWNYYVMGQVCVAGPYRGQGVFDLLYQTHREILAPRYQMVITEISTRNIRSLRAHQRVGFHQIDVYRDPIDEWSVVVWDWETTQGHP